MLGYAYRLGIFGQWKIKIMSEWNGKGSKSRVNDYNSYWNSPLWDKKSKSEKKFLFLDDERKPREAFLYDENRRLLEKSGILEYQWDIVRSYDEFVNYIEKNGIPDVVSFDNDLFNLSSSKYSVQDVDKQFRMENWEEFTIKTGAHCAQYLVEACKAHGKPIPIYHIHTANSAARPIIQKILEHANV